MSVISDSNEQQIKAITHDQGPQLIVAGAGTGKTRVITTRIAYLITEKNVGVDQILALTFTEKAAGEMEERVDLMIPYGYVDLWIYTFHAFCDKVLKYHALDIGLDSNYHVLDEVQTWMLMKKNLDKFNLDYYKPLGNPTKFIQALIKHFSRCKDECIQPQDYLDHAENLKLNNDDLDFVKNIDLSDLSDQEKLEITKGEVLRLQEIANAYHVYQQILIDNNSLDFADLINYTIKLFKDRPLILNKYRQQFKYILVDEFQDTNLAQYELIKLLAKPKNNLTVVGDDDQSIYRFRGSSITNIMKFKQDFPETKEVVLTDNYRSCQEILDTAYNFIKQNNPDRLEEKLGIDKKLKSHLPQKAEIQHLNFNTAEDEVVGVLNKIVEIKNKENIDWSHFAILVRANDSANLFLNNLDKENIPFQFLAMKGLYNKPVIMDILSYFKLLDNYHESTAVFRALNFDYLDLDSEQIVKLVHYAKQKSCSLYQILKQANVIPEITSETITKINKLIAQIEKDTALVKTKKTTEILLNFLYNSGYLEFIKNLPEQKAKENISYLDQYFKKIQKFESEETDPRLADFLEFQDLEIEAGDSGKLAFDVETGPDMVKIMTVHSAKGLEFDYVFIVNLVDRKFPTDKRSEQIEIPTSLVKEQIPQGDFHLQEERRLFYVAMTRAKKGLYFTSAEDYGGARKKKFSRFLFELGYKQENPINSNKSLEKVEESKKEKQDFVYELPKQFSFSQLQTYESCPLQYKYKYILKVPAFGNHYLSFGSTIHDTLQQFLQQCFEINNVTQINLFDNVNENKKQLLPLEELLKVYESFWQDDWYKDEKQKNEYFELGKKLLKNFYVKFDNEKPKVKMLEQPFKLKIKDYIIAGRIDRIDDVEKGEVEIVDYKTGKAKDKLTADDKRQLLLYQIAVEEILKLKLNNLTYYYLNEDKEVSFLGADKDKEKLKQSFINDIEQIKSQNFEPKPSSFVCDNCDYRGICEFRK